MRPLPVPFADVLAAARADSPWGYTTLYEWLAPAVAAYLRRAGSAEPEDRTGETFLDAFRSLDRFEGDETAFRSWLFVIAHRRLIDERRRRGRRVETVPLGAEDGVASGGVESEALAQLGSERVRGVLAGLAPDQRDVLLLRVFADLTVEQVAVVLGKRPGAVKALQRRGLAALRREIPTEGIPLSGSTAMTEV